MNHSGTLISPHIGLNAHLLSSQAGYRRAGIHTYQYNVLAQLPTMAPDWRFTAMVGRADPPAHPRLSVRHSRMDTESPTRRILWEQLAQPWQLSDYDLVHQMAFVAPLIMPKPFVVTVYDLTFMRFPERLPRSRRLYLRLFTRLACQRAKRVIAISQSTADDLVQLLSVPRDRIDLAIPGIDPQLRPLSTAELATWRATTKAPTRFLLCVGTLEPRKNLTTLIAAYGALPAADRARVHLVLAGGKGWMFDAIEQQIIELGLTETVHLPGFLSDDALVGWYNAAEAFVYPSLFEGWGMPVTEAMACGTPVVVSNRSSLPEAAGETGILVPPQDIAAWQQALAQVIHDPTWREVAGAAARERSLQFSWSTTAAQTILSYQKALSHQ